MKNVTVYADGVVMADGVKLQHVHGINVPTSGTMKMELPRRNLLRSTRILSEFVMC